MSSHQVCLLLPNPWTTRAPCPDSHGVLRRRFEKFSETFTLNNGEYMLLDYSKNLIDEKTMKLLFELAKDCKVEEMRGKMFSGEKINVTEVFASSDADPRARGTQQCNVGVHKSGNRNQRPPGFRGVGRNRSLWIATVDGRDGSRQQYVGMGHDCRCVSCLPLDWVACEHVGK